MLWYNALLESLLLGYCIIGLIVSWYYWILFYVLLSLIERQCWLLPHFGILTQRVPSNLLPYQGSLVLFLGLVLFFSSHLVLVFQSIPCLWGLTYGRDKTYLGSSCLVSSPSVSPRVGSREIGLLRSKGYVSIGILGKCGTIRCNSGGYQCSPKRRGDNVVLPRRHRYKIWVDGEVRGATLTEYIREELAVYAENMSQDTKRKFCFVNIGFNELDGMQQLRSMKGTIKPMGITESDHERNYSSCDEGHTTYEGLKNHRQLT